jgi:hypothetical protein
VRKDLVDIFQDLENGNIPIFYEAPQTTEFVRLSTYEKPAAGPVRHVSVDEYLATRRERAG